MRDRILHILRNLGILSEVTFHTLRGLQCGKNVHIYRSLIDLGPEGRRRDMVEIGDNTTISFATILTHDASARIFTGKVVTGPVKIGMNCFIGYGSIILPGVTIGDNCIVGAGSVVSNDVPPGTVAVGVPARRLCTLEEFLKKIENRK
ncbi:MAG: acyltransferase [Theionarchaea archaeon]|nr:acyltransferase [Theionarchaea archaeon]MBU7038889.1 acyltransferase [Theionarchaea archaeon]